MGLYRGYIGLGVEGIPATVILRVKGLGFILGLYRGYIGFGV